MHGIYEITKPASLVFGGTGRTDLFESADLDLLEGPSACGSFSIALARALLTAGIRTRIAQMYAYGRWGGHIFVEAKIDGRWIVLDPASDFAFRRRDGMLATVQEVRAQWEDYRRQLPSDYRTGFRFEAVRYTDWDRIPGSSMVKPLAARIFGRNAVDEFCIRVYFLNLYRTYAIVLFGLQLLLGGISLAWWLLRSRRRVSTYQPKVAESEETLDEIFAQ
jgi:hypothetical protein